METNDAPTGEFHAPGSMMPDSPAKTRRDRGNRNLPLIAALCFVALGGLLLASGVITGRSGPPPATGLYFTIPAGTKETVARPGFDSAIPIPTDIRFASPAEAVITIQNLDDVQHRAGPFVVGARQTFVQRFPEPGRYPILCTVDPLETVVVTVDA